MSKKEDRAARKAAIKEKKQSASAILRQKNLSLATGEKNLQTLNPAPSSDKKIINLETVTSAKVQIKLPVLDISTDRYRLEWSHVIADCDGAWSWRENRKWTDNEWACIKSLMDDFANKTWGEIKAERTGGERRRKKHHFQEVDSIINEAQDRWRSLPQINNVGGVFDTAFRFRFGGTIRLWGVVSGYKFYIIWYERLHKIYPVDP